MLKIRTGNQFRKYIGKGDIDFPEIYFHQDEVMEIAKAFLIAGRSRTLVINTRDAMLVEAIDALVDDNDGQVEFLVDDIYEDEITNREIDPSELYKLYNTIGRAYRHKIDREQIFKRRNGGRYGLKPKDYCENCGN